MKAGQFRKPTEYEQDLLSGISVRLVKHSEQEDWDATMRRNHYLGFEGFIGHSLRYVAEVDGRWMALIGWQGAALKCKPRDRWIGWPAALQFRRLPFVVNNSRFLILPGAHIPNLASRVLSLNLSRLSGDWKALHGHPTLIAETFIDPERFTGASYLAANWEVVGRTQGYSMKKHAYIPNGKPKLVLVYPLYRQGRMWLSDPDWDDQRRKMNPKAMTIKQMEEIRELLHALPDCRYRRGIRYRYRTVITIGIAAVLCGAKSFVELGEFASALTQSQLKRLGSRYKNGRFEAPTESTLRRVLQSSDPVLIDRALGQWLLKQSNDDESVAVDGKVLRGARREDGSQVNLMAVFLHEQGIA